MHEVKVNVPALSILPCPLPFTNSLSRFRIYRVSLFVAFLCLFPFLSDTCLIGDLTPLQSVGVSILYFYLNFCLTVIFRCTNLCTARLSIPCFCFHFTFYFTLNLGRVKNTEIFILVFQSNCLIPLINLTLKHAFYFS